jgi:rfaE bifunctional protein kinase chain/domain
LENIEWLLQSGKIDVIILEDYNKGVLTFSVIKKILEAATQKKIPVAVDPKERNFWEYEGVSLFKPNLREVESVLGKEVKTREKELKRVSETIQKNLQNRITLITLSENGLYFHESGFSALFPSVKRNVADVSGAGDTVIAVVALSLALNLQPKELALLANLAGGQVVEKVGVVPVDAIELEKEFRMHEKTLAKL